MKISFALILLCLSCAAFAQQPKVYKLPLQNPKDWERKSYRDSMMERINMTHPALAANQAKLSHVLPNGNSVYILPQDNMPCVVPATIGNMPVIAGNATGQIPNLSPRQQIIPRRDSLRYKQ